jgi:PIN domain nuclease of toxin-antitoxin system
MATVEPIYVLDTHALIWHLTQETRLGATVKAIFEAAMNGETRLVIPSIVVAELYYANKKWGLFEDFQQTYSTLRAQSYFLFVPFLADDVEDFSLNETVPEMHDRIIAGVARRLDAPLITVDAKIVKSGVARVTW